MKLGSLFSGCGGFDLAGQRVGMDVTWHSEIEKNACRVLEHHWSSVRNYGDITGIRAERLPAVDVVTGGFPCQDLSVAGKRQGLAGARSGLWWQFARLLREVQPTWVVIENVPGLLSSNGGNDMGTVLWTLGDMGYGWAYRVLDAQWAGLAQRRKRVFIVGHLGDRRAPATVLFEPESVPRHSPPRREAGQRPAGTLEARVRGGGYGYDTDTLNYVASPLTAGSNPNSNAAGRRREDDVNLAIAVSLRGRDGGATAELGGDVSPAIRSSQGGGDKPHVMAFDVRQITSKDNRSRVEPGLPAPTLNSDSGMHVAHTLSAEGHDASEDGTGRGTPLVPVTYPTISAHEGGTLTQIPPISQGMMVRRLTPLECSRLMGLPDSWLDLDPPLSDSAKYRLLGNAVAVPVVEWILGRIAQYERRVA